MAIEIVALPITNSDVSPFTVDLTMKNAGCSIANCYS
jgi:hypothetical protein